MKNRIRKEGTYELFVTPNKHTILALDQTLWFAVIKGQQGEILVGSDPDHDKSKTVSSGKFMLVDFDDDPQFRDMPHLFLQKGKSYEEWILPNELPLSKGDKVKVIKTKYKIDEDKISEHTQNKFAESTGNLLSGLNARSVKELQNMARQKGVRGRAKMKKEELINALS